uniref:Uncharacterized protein n=1 Tax=Magallana gigas TaxID=29159 RepID=A0A8W8N563_MAGGI
ETNSSMAKLLIALTLILCLVAMASMVSASYGYYKKKCYNMCHVPSHCQPWQYCDYVLGLWGYCCDKYRKY